MSDVTIATPALRSFTARLWAEPRALVAGIIALHVVVWGAVPALVQPNLPLDVVEQLAWGREWQLSYFKHPPLPAWILELAAILTNGSDRAIFFVGPLVSGLALWLIYLLARRVLDQRGALCAVLLQEGVLYFTFFTPELNHNVVQLPLWALIGWTGYRAIMDDRAFDWIAFGAAAALGLYGKYSTALLLITLALFLLLEPTARRRLARPGPWLALLALLIVLTPHLVALARIDFTPFRFPLERAHAASHASDRLLFPLKFVGAQVLDLLPALVLIAFVRRGGMAPAVAPDSFARRYVTAIAWGPLVLTVLAAVISGRQFKDMWATPFFDWFGLFVVLVWCQGAPRMDRRFAIAWAAVFLAGPLAYAAQFPAQTLAPRTSLRAEFPGPELATDMQLLWRDKVGAPLRTVAGSVWLAGNVAFPLWPDRPAVMIDGDPQKSPWISAADLACGGALLVWDKPAQKSELLARFPGAEEQPSLDLKPRSWAAKSPITIGSALVLPDGSCGRNAAASPSR